MELFFILGIPLCLAIASLLVRRSSVFGIFNALGYLVILCVSLRLSFDITKGVTPFIPSTFFHIDALSAYFILLIALINFISSIYSIGYIASDVKEGAISERKASGYWTLYNLFAFTMFFVTVVNNLGVMWVSIEMTTLISAFLVGFYNTKKSIEAAWKYIIICSAGIVLAFLGTILLYYTVSRHGGINSLNWTEIVSVARNLDPRVTKIAFLFILVGYGTKAGLAPMHTWLPDAHSQALSPVSALLSGVLLKTAFYAIIRFTIIVNKCVPSHYTQNLFIFFGIISLGIAAGFILVQKDIKRLLAYSSVEHIGIISIGLGFGGILGIYGALFHAFNHAVTKALMFLGAGSTVRKYKTSNMHLIKGVINVMWQGHRHFQFF
ncbi:MAG: hydrogenase 4 subunit F [Candidatus Omnitrophica bacterium]|nr:hydrogenase 4 subunit F [Candidatus Omnitrophota bacterium]